jgi:predicted enzyme related to lactoylglutathione lyase
MNDVDLQSVYIVAQDMDTLHTFYESALGLVPRFRDSNNWTQFKLARGDFALSSIDEAAEGAVGAVPVFKVDKFEEVTQKIRSLGGQFLSERSMGKHGVVCTCKDPEGNVFQIFRKTVQ